MRDDHKTWLQKMADILSREPQNREELLEILRDAHERQLLNYDALSMIEGVLQVSHMQARDIMIPRAQMKVIQSNASHDDMIAIISESGHSRFPVLSEDKEEVVGVLLAKELVVHYKKKEPLQLLKILRPAVFIPESKRLDVLLKEFRQNRNHMAIVIDEYGGIAGLITIEDVLEEIVGDIEDEYDHDQHAFIRQVNDKEYMIHAQTPIEDINDYFKTNIKTNEVDTFGGLVLKQVGYVPTKGEVIKLANFNVKILDANQRRIHLMKVTHQNKL